MRSVIFFYSTHILLWNHFQGCGQGGSTQVVTGQSTYARLIRVFFFAAVLTLPVTIFQVQEYTGGQRAVHAGTCEAAFRVDEAGTDPEVRISVRVAAPWFEIDGAQGFYREKEPGHCLVRVTGPARVEFSAAPLYSLTGRKKARLNVVYWVDSPEKQSWSFRPGGPPLVLPLTRDTQRFNIYGGVAINEVSEQPAGEYRGSITVTLFSY